MNIKVFTKESDFISASLKYIENICFSAIQNMDIALSGGMTPSPIYKAMAESKKIPFGIIDFWQVDERYVENNQTDSNQKMIRENLLSNNIQPAGLHFFDTTLSMEEAVKKYEKELDNELQSEFDLVILGIGTDGHTGSIFPHSKAVQENNKLVTSTKTTIHPISDRLTLTFPAIFNSKKILILLKGPEKESILHELTNGTKTAEEFPAKKILKHKDVTIHALL